MLIVVGVIWGSSLVAEGKTQTNLLTQNEINIIRTTQTWPGVSVNDALTLANKWMKYSIKELRDLVPPAHVGRNPNVHQDQCPEHPDAIKSVGKYPWIIDPDKPYKVICPIGGEVYPTNDFDPYNIEKLGTVSSEPYVDYGSGYLNLDNSEEYYFVGYYAHWMYYGHLKPVAVALGQAYIITGEQKYARQAAALLDRIAEEYPEMVLPNGRIVNSVWETEMVRCLATAYDYIYQGLDGDNVLEESVGKSVTQIRQNIETNLLENAAQSIYTMDGHVRGNYGMHQNTLAILAVVLDNRNTDQYLDMVLYATGIGRWEYEGIINGLANMIYRDGAPLESSPFYNAFWMQQIDSIAKIMLSRGVNLYTTEAKLKSLLEYPLRIAMLDKYSPNIGDAGGVKSSGIEGWDNNTYSTAYEQYGDMVFRAGKSLSQESDNMSAYGLALLRSGQGLSASGIALYYGRGSGHDHFGRLNIEFFAKQLRISPDVGYPDYCDYADKKRWGFVSNTVSHNTVVVDAQRQTTRNSGKMQLFNSTPRVQYIDASAEEAYPGIVDQYRRSVILVGVEKNESYAIDLFRVSGGKQHDYSLHGPDGSFSVSDLTLSEPNSKGTLVGENVPFGYLYDLPQLEAPGYNQGYNVYSGSGFSYFQNPQQGTPTGVWEADWLAAGTQSTHFRATFVPEQGSEVFVADAEPPKNVVGNPESLKYVFVRRTSQDGKKINSTFVTVMQPYTDTPFIHEVKRLSVDKDGVVALQVSHASGVDFVVQSLQDEIVTTNDADIKFHGTLGVISRSYGGLVRYANLVDGGLFQQGDVKITAADSYAGQVLDVNYKEAKVTVRLAKNIQEMPLEKALFNQRIVFTNKNQAKTEYVVDGVKALEDRIYEIQLVEKSLAIGSAKANSIGNKSLFTKTALPLCDLYLGQMLVNQSNGKHARITSVKGTGEFSLQESQTTLYLSDDVGLCQNDSFSIYDFGEGDQFLIASSVYLEQTSVGVYKVTSNVAGELTLWDNVERDFDCGESEFSIPILSASIVHPMADAKVTGKVIPSWTLNVPTGLVVQNIKVYMDETPIYTGITLPEPGQLSIDTYLLEDGGHKLSIVVTDQNGKSFAHSIQVAVENWWSIDTELEAPIVTGWFGTVDSTHIYDKSAGWEFVEGTSSDFFNDTSRMMRSNNNTEYIIWEALQLQQIELTVYTQSSDVKGVELSVSPDGVEWAPVPFTIFADEINAAGWHKLLLCGQAPATQKSTRFFKVEIADFIPAQQLQLGRTKLAGYVDTL